MKELVCDDKKCKIEPVIEMQQSGRGISSGLMPTGSTYLLPLNLSSYRIVKRGRKKSQSGRGFKKVLSDQTGKGRRRRGKRVSRPQVGGKKRRGKRRCVKRKKR